MANTQNRRVVADTAHDLEADRKAIQFSAGNAQRRMPVRSKWGVLTGTCSDAATELAKSGFGGGNFGGLMDAVGITSTSTSRKALS